MLSYMDAHRHCSLHQIGALTVTAAQLFSFAPARN